ncbi:hypothetical protein Gogos_006418 [Gossypium gossypioides]|uniref:Uncharacterized protein n=1 Tax=Gossypium gossypioides TaxID=34282 RepID=A0A7J9C5J5_GOSGO|nr:hypothetical protein [Gossypium gossypioides]
MVEMACFLQKGRTRSPSMSLFKEALTLLHTKPVAEMVPNWKPFQVDVDTKVRWKALVVGLVHPVHLQSTLLSPSHSLCIKVPAPKIMSLLSPMAFSISSFEVVSTSDVSLYGSPCEGSDKEKCDEHNEDSNEEIDVKAEDQIRLQTLNS